MAAITGYRCDVCGNFTEDRADWLTLASVAESAGQRPWDICSNRCLVNKAMERAEAMGEDLGLKVSPAKATRTYKARTDDEKMEVALYAAEHGATEAAKKFDAHYSSVTEWMRKFNL
jgi:hypothetical protein